FHNIHDLGFDGPDRNSRMAGLRRCPNPECQSLIFTAAKNGKLETSYPSEVIDFDATNLPEAILSSLEEGIKAHAAGCYRAAALMVRRVLEELCKDKKATGNNLKEKLGKLKGSVVIPQELLDGADELRILGNNAAHVEAEEYDAIGPDQSALAIELTKELL